MLYPVENNTNREQPPKYKRVANSFFVCLFYLFIYLLILCLLIIIIIWFKGMETILIADLTSNVVLLSYKSCGEASRANDVSGL